MSCIVNRTLPAIMRVKQQLEHSLCASGNHASPAVIRVGQ